MTQPLTYCALGCVRARAHLPACGDSSCRGCEPRQARHGRLCASCHHNLAMLLTDAPHIVDWLRVYLPRGSSPRARTDAERRHGTAAPPPPLDLSALDLIDTWRASLGGWAENLSTDQHLTGPRAELTPTGHTVTDVHACARFMLTWQSTLEALPWVEYLLEELSWLTRESRLRAPWSPEVRRVTGIPCPECHTCALVVYGGQTDVTCAHCHLVIPESRYGIWTRMLAAQHRATA